MRKTTFPSATPSRRAETAAGWEDSIDRALSQMLTSEDPVQRAIAARLIVGDMYPSRREGRLH
jgi:hypothetical protein